MYKWLSLLSEMLKYCILNEKIWWIFKETSVGFFPPIPLSPTKQHHTFAQFKQNLHERGLLYAAIPGKAKTGVCGIVMCSPHQKMLRPLCIKSGGMLLPWEVSLQMKRIIRMYCSWLNGLTFSFKVLTFPDDGFQSTDISICSLSENFSAHPSSWLTEDVSLHTSYWECTVVCALGSFPLLNSLYKYLGLFLIRFKQQAYLEQPTTIKYSRSLWAPKVYLMYSCCGAFFPPLPMSTLEVVLC